MNVVKTKSVDKQNPAVKVNVYRVRTGQSHPYADHENVYQVEFIDKNSKHGSFLEKKEMIKVAKVLVGANGLKMRSSKKATTQEMHHHGWIDYATIISPNVVEIMFCYPYFD
jgi:hypothetical protein